MDKMNQFESSTPPRYEPVVSQPGAYGDDPRIVPGSQMASFHQPFPQPAIGPQVVVLNQTQVRAGRDWASGICDCCADMSVCCTVAFCMPCSLCNLSSRMGEGCCMPCCVPQSLMALRIKMRAEHGIQGSISNDHCVTCCCAPCALCQMKREHDMLSQAILAQQMSPTSTTVQMA